MRYRLPESVTVEGRTYPIRSDYRAILDILAAFNDPELSDEEKMIVCLSIFYPEYPNVNPDHIEKLYQETMAFIDAGMPKDDKEKPALVYWEQDEPLIVPAINKIAHRDIRSSDHLHWWTFIGYFMEIGESLFSTIIDIRSKKAKGKKLEKYEQEFFKENKHLILRQKSADEQAQIEAEKAAINAMLGY